MGEDDLPRGRCDEYNWSPPISFEAVWPIIMLGVFSYMVYYTRQIYQQKLEARPNRNCHSSKSPFHICGMALPNLKSRSEKVDIKLLFLYELFLGINLIRVAIHKIPWFEDSLVSNKNDNLKHLMIYCNIERFLAFVLPTLQFWAMFRLLFSRLFCVFEVAPTLRFSDTFIRSSTAFVDIVVILLTLGLFSVSVFDSSACVRIWTPVDAPNHKYYNCSAELSLSLSLTVGVSYPVMIATNLFTLILFIKKFLQLTESVQRSHQSSSNSYSSRTRTMEDANVDEQKPVKKQMKRKKRKVRWKEMDQLSPVLKVMIKLTTLSVTAIISSFIILIVLSLMVIMPINVEFMLFLDYTINCLCLLLVFKWMHREYETLCNNRCCVIHNCIQSSVDSGLLHKVLASNASPKHGPRVMSVECALSTHQDHNSSDITNTSVGSSEVDFTGGWQTPTSQPSVPKAFEP